MPHFLCIYVVFSHNVRIDLVKMVVNSNYDTDLIDVQHLLSRLPDEILEYDVSLLQKYLTAEAWKVLESHGLSFLSI